MLGHTAPLSESAQFHPPDGATAHLALANRGPQAGHARRIHPEPAGRAQAAPLQDLYGILLHRPLPVWNAIRRHGPVPGGIGETVTPGAVGRFPPIRTAHRPR